MQLTYSINEASKVLSIGKTKLYKAINNGTLKARKYGKRTIILQKDIDSFLNNLDSYPIKSKGEQDVL